MDVCTNCNDEGWVCENHQDRPWLSGKSRCCAEDPPNDDHRWEKWGCGAGAPCPMCNEDLKRGLDYGFDAIVASVDPIPPDKQVH